MRSRVKEVVLVVTASQPYLSLNNNGRSLQFPLTQAEHRLGRDPQWADLQVPPDWAVISQRHATLRRIGSTHANGSTYEIYDGDGHHPSTNGTFVNRVRVTPSTGYRLIPGVQMRIGQNPANAIALTYLDPSTPGGKAIAPSVSLATLPVSIGRDPSSTLCLNSPLVSRRHAAIEADNAGGYRLRDSSSNGVYVGDRRVSGTTPLHSGDTIRIGPFLLKVQGQTLSLFDPGTQLRLDAANVVREVGKGGTRKRLLDDISLAIEPGQLVALVGGSGAGKSTLLRSLLGTEPLSDGAVYLNGDDIRQAFALYRTLIGYVPQDDIVHRQLSVEEVLTFAAKLRLSPDADIDRVVTETLETVELSDRRTVPVSQLSGGQRKRVSIGVELLADPKLFLLDEPTSGLDPGLDRKMMSLLRQLADRGRTVVLVTHATTNIKVCDRVAVLGRGGKLCYFGPPATALTFGEVDSGDFVDLYAELDEEPAVRRWAVKFRQSEAWRQYVAQSLSPGRGEAIAPLQPFKTDPLRQFWLLALRYLSILKRDPVNVALWLGTAPVGIALMQLALGDRAAFVPAVPPNPMQAPLALRVLFVVVCISLWVGLSSSLPEVVKESLIYRRERLVNLKLGSYLGSKIAVLASIAVVQTILIAIALMLGFDSPSAGAAPWGVGLALTAWLTLIASTSLGLLASTAVRNVSQASGLLPFLLIPQFVFAGVLFEATGMAKVLSWFTISRWAIGAYGALVDVNGMVPPPMPTFAGQFAPQPFVANAIYDATFGNLLQNWLGLGLHAIAYLAIALFLLARKDRQ